MQTKKRLPASGLVRDLFDAPQRFQFVQAVRILQHWLKHEGVPGGKKIGEVLRFENSLSLTFPASEIEALSELRGPSGEPKRITLTPGFFGLLGTCGALPMRYTERVAMARQWSGDAAPHEFMNLLSHRLLMQHFQAWAKHRLECALELEGKDCLLPILTAIAGVPPTSPAAQQASAVGYYSALFGTRPATANSIAAVLGRHFGVPMELEPFVATWDMVPDDKRSKLSRGVARLGYGAMLGKRILRRDIGVRLNVGPLCRSEMERFLPHRPGAQALANMVGLFGLDGLRVGVRLMLDPSCVQRLTLTSEHNAARRLGWDAFLIGNGTATSRAFIKYLLPLPAGRN